MCSNTGHGQDCVVHYVDIDITHYGPFQTLYAAISAARLTLLDCISNNQNPASVWFRADRQIKLHVELHDSYLHPLDIYQEVADRLGNMLDHSLRGGRIVLGNWHGCRMQLSERFPDL